MEIDKSVGVTFAGIRWVARFEVVPVTPTALISHDYEGSLMASCVYGKRPLSLQETQPHPCLSFSLLRLWISFYACTVEKSE